MPLIGLKHRELTLIRQADRARDARHWQEAASLYRKALERNPRNPPIWVQYGHALKESRLLAEAEDAYRRALAYEPGVADSHLQLGHALKLQGKKEAAQAAYLRAFALDPTLPYPSQELGALGFSEAWLKELAETAAPAARQGTDPLGQDRPIEITDAEIRCLKSPKSGDEVALFITHSPHGRLKPHVRHYVDSLTRQGVAVTLIVATDVPFTAATSDLLNAVDGLFVRQNIGYDFGAWAHVLRLHIEFIKANILYILNDSLFGPTNDAALRDLLGRIRGSNADFIGLTESYERNWHLQSYFWAIKSRALGSATFGDFVDGIGVLDREGVITEYELRLAPMLKAAGFTCEAMFHAADSRNPTQHRWRELLESGFPFIKISTASGIIPDLDVSDWRAMMRARGYDVSLAEQTLTLDAAPKRSAAATASLKSRIAASGLFNPQVYLAQNEEIRSIVEDPWDHFVNHGLSEGRHFTNSEEVARVLSQMALELRASRDEYSASAARALAGEDNSHIAARFRRDGVRIGIFCSAQGNFYMREFADLLTWGLRAAGIEAVQRDETADKKEPFHLRVFVAPHEFFTLGEGLSWVPFAEAPDSVLYNVEQVQTPWFCRVFGLLLKAPLILDANFQSAEILRRAGCNVVHFVPGHLAAAPCAKPYVDMSGVRLVEGYPFARRQYDWLQDNRLADRPIDLLFVGSAAPRRDEALRRLRELSDRHRFLCVYGRQNAPLTAENHSATSTEIVCGLAQRAKIVLNLHRDWVGYFEWPRVVSQGIWQGACVVSDPCMPSPIFEAGTHYLEESLRHIGELARWLLETREGQETLETTRMAGYRHATELGSMRVALAPVLDAFQRMIAASADARVPLVEPDP